MNLIAETDHKLALAETSLEELPLADDASLEVVLNAWHDATVRLEQTHQRLQAEVSRLTDELEEKNRELARQNRLADLGRMASHVAHEVRNSLVPVTLYLSLLRRRLSDDSGSVDILAKVEAGFTALNTTVNDLLNFSSHREPQWTVFSMEPFVNEVCEAIQPQLDAQKIEVEVDVSVGQSVLADREMLRRAVLNLLLNAVDAMPEGGALLVTSFEGPRGIELEVADNGPGLSEEQLAHLFDPFYTTKASGTGLGLSIVHRIAEAHGGSVIATNCPDGGAAFTIEIPRRRAMGAAA